MKTTRTVTVEWQLDGYHNWPDATSQRKYLASKHRHRFHFAVTIPVNHNERDIEFHDLLEHCQQLVNPNNKQTIDFGAASCETIAETLANKTLDTYNLPWIETQVSEDNYVTATIRIENQ